MTQTDTITPVQLPLQKFYDAELLEVPLPARNLLEGYSKVPSEDVLPHILEVRNNAWSTYPCPSIGHFDFLDVTINKSRAYKDIVSRLQKGQILLEVECGLGQDLRQLVADGAPSENLYGIDTRADFFDFGNNLFRDGKSFNGLFLQADILTHNELLDQLKHKVDMIWVGGVLVQYEWHKQVAALRHMLRLLKPTPHSLIAGWFVGEEKSKIQGFGYGGEHFYRHDIKSFKKLLHEAADSLDEKWEVDTLVQSSGANGHVKHSGSKEPVKHEAKRIGFVASKLERLDKAMYPSDASMNMDIF